MTFHGKSTILNRVILMAGFEIISRWKFNGWLIYHEFFDAKSLVSLSEIYGLKCIATFFQLVRFYPLKLRITWTRST